MRRPFLLRPTHRRGRDHGYLALLALQLLQQIYTLEHKPPATLGLIAACVGVFLLGPDSGEGVAGIPSVQQGGLQPYSIVQRQQWGRLLWAGFLHADEHHLYYNMASLLWKGVQLEAAMGSASFAALVLELLLVSHTLFVAACYALASSFIEYRRLPIDMNAVGFSAVLFGLKVVLNHETRDAWGHVLGIRLPVKYLCWAELLLASYLNPRSSFLGHLAGIVAGYFHVKVTRRLAAAVGPWLRGLQPDGRRARPAGAAARPPERRQAADRFAAAAPPPRGDAPEAQPPHHHDHGPQPEVQLPSAEELRQLRLRRFEAAGR